MYVLYMDSLYYVTHIIEVIVPGITIISGIQYNTIMDWMFTVNNAINKLFWVFLSNFQIQVCLRFSPNSIQRFQMYKLMSSS